MNRRLQLFRYLFFDIFSAALAWGLFYSYRKLFIESAIFNSKVPMDFGPRFYSGLIFVTTFWILLYYASGFYREVIRKSRLSELWYTLRMSMLGVVILFFGILLDDTIANYSHYYKLFTTLFLLHFTLTYIPRLIITTRITHKIHRGEIGFNTLIIGGNEKAAMVYDEIHNQMQSTGNVIRGFVSVLERDKYELSDSLPLLGKTSELKDIIEKHDVKEVIIAIEYSEHEFIEHIMNTIIDCNVIVKAIPGMYEIFTGKVKMSEIMGTPLIEISHELMPPWQENLKHFLDIIFALIALTITAPLLVILAIGIKATSKGPLFYKQERVGKNGKPFTIYKFRSMIVGAESDGPQLSSHNDDRITKIGRFMRRTRLDEFPNFYNVLKGDMSIVGPRPERQFFIDQIVEKAPQYIQLLKVRPGITSWGQVKYGYAENTDQMVRRMKFDLIYLDNMTLYVDFKIMIYTLMTMLKGKGK